jgi:transglutaminase-like putative cysteine protease
MKPSVVESRPPENAGNRSSHTPYQPEIHIPDLDSQRQSLQYTGRTSQKYQLTLMPGEGWFAMLLLAIAVYSVVFSIISANWVDFSYILLFSTALGLILGLCIAKIQWFPQAILHLAAVLLGHWFSIWLVSTFAYHNSWLLLLQNIRSVMSGGFISTTPANSEMVFLFYLTFLSFFLAYFGAWLIYRARLPWLVALVYCAIMLVNLNYTKQDVSYLMIIMLAALILLIVRIQLVDQLTIWASEGLYIDRVWLRNITRRFIQIGSLFTLFILLISLMLPIVSQSASGVNFWNNLDTIWANITQGRFSLSSPGMLLQPYQTATNFFGDQLSITGNVNLPTGEVLYYSSASKSQPQYLEGFTYDKFDGHTWTSTASDATTPVGASKNLAVETTNSRQQATTTVTIVKPPEGTKHYLFAPSQPFIFSVPTALYGNDITTAWTQQNPLMPGEHYNVTSQISTATASELSNVQFPQHNLHLWPNLDPSYLQKPADLSNNPIIQRTLQRWTQGSTNVYTAVKALESHLSDQTQFSYSVTNPQVPPNVDAVAWLLQTHQGYCTYYASAMVVMARILHIPARIVNGFSQGNLQGNTWVVNGEDAHSWVQVYFPSYGWINFDPTPGYTVPGGSLAQQSPTPVQTQSPTIPTPIATAGHPKPKPQPTPKPGLTGTGTNTISSDAILRQNLFLTLSLITLFGSLVVFGIALLFRYKDHKLSATTTATMVYSRVCRLAAFIGIPPQRWQTPYEYYHVLGRRFPQAAASMRRITEFFVRERWAASYQLPDPAEEQALAKLWPQLRNTLIRSLFSRKGK